MAKQLWWHNTLAFVDIELIHKPWKNNVVLNVLNRKEEYRGEMPWGSIQAIQAMVVKER